MTHEEMTREFNQRVDLIKYLVEKDITDYREINNLIVLYYKDATATITKIREEMGWTVQVQMEGGAVGA